MTQEEILQYNKRCSKVLGKEYDNNKIVSPYTHFSGQNPSGKVWEDCKFHSDWNWIMEVVAQIQLLNIVHDNTRSYDSVYKEWQCTFSPSYKTHDFGYIVGKSKTSEKEAVVQAINQFLIWYEKN